MVYSPSTSVKMAFQKIQEYISTDKGSAGELLIPKLILPTMIEEVDKNLIDRSLASMLIGPNQFQGSSMTLNLEEPDTLDIREVGEGAEIPLDTQDYTTVTFTPKKYGVAVRITREMVEDSQFELFNRNIKAAGKRFAENETKLILEALDGANATTAGGASITIANIAESMYDLESNDYMPTDMLVGDEVVQDLRQIDTFAEADKWGDKTSFNRTGFIAAFYGMKIHRFSTQAAPSTDYAKYAYILDRDQAYGIAISRDITVENFTLPSYDMDGAAITQRIDVQLLRSKAVSKITTS
jgi:hypothetical protein